MRSYLIYTRVSTLQQNDNTSISRQVETCDRWGKDNGWLYVEHIHDSITGKSYSERPGIQKVLDLVESGRVTDVICYSVDRTGREAMVIQTFFKDIYLRGGKVTLVSKSKTYPTFASIKKDTLFDVAVAEWEHSQIEDRMSQGKMFVFSEVKSYIYSPVYGYDIKSENITHNGHKVKRTYLVPNESEADTIRIMLDKYLEVKSYAQTARYMNSIGIKTKKNGKFSNTQLRIILDRVDMYAGLPREETYMGATREMTYPAIISPELAQQVKLTMSVAPKKQEESTTDTPPFIRLIKCKRCGRLGVSNMGYHKGADTTFGFICQSLKLSRNDKHESGVNATRVTSCKSQIALNAFKNAMSTFLDTVDIEGIETQFEAELAKLVVSVKRTQLDIAEKQKERDALKKKQSNIIDATLKLTGDDDFAELIAAYNEKSKEITQSLTSIDDSIKLETRQYEARLRVFESLGISLADIEKFSPNLYDYSTQAI